jgi:hypothetical protein
MLLLTPYYLRNASWTFTSAGPIGGVIYPTVISVFAGFPFYTRADQWIQEALPPILEPLSQLPGEIISISGFNTLGPFVALLIGLASLGFPRIWKLVGSRPSEKRS